MWYKTAIEQLRDLQIFENQIKTELGLEEFDLHETKSGDIILDIMVVPKGSRKQGIGSEAMRRLIDYADSHGRRVLLSAADKGYMDATTSKSRLIKFYRQFGFVPNKGRYKDFQISQNMLRKPQGGTNVV
jgi:GNAT superfamily N-acetyltransferase